MGNAEQEFPEISAEVLTTYILAAAKYVEAAEVSRTQEDQHRNSQSAQLALRAVHALRSHRTVGILTEMQVNTAMLSLWCRLRVLEAISPGTLKLF